ncbi:MAG: NTF2 fold immunity protein [Planctomycetota bacterium]|nr:NTF2 fold immunity protein [Planctomycetota bacterium]
MIELSKRLEDGLVDEAAYRNRVVAGKNDLMAIYATFCDAGEKASRFKDQGLSWLGEIEHAPGGEVVESCKLVRHKMVIETRQTIALMHRRRYEVIERDGVWKLRDVLYYSTLGNPEKRRKEML